MRFRIEWRDEAWNVGSGEIEAESQLLAEVAFIKAAQDEGRKLWCTWSCRSVGSGDSQ